MTTSDTVFDQYGKKFPIEVTGSGRINVSKAIDAELIITLQFQHYPYRKKMDWLLKRC